MEKPKRSNDKYWKGSHDFNHLLFESDLDDYICFLEELADSKDKLYPKEFIEWLKDFCDRDVENDEMMWKVHTDTHIFELMDTDKAFDFWQFTKNDKKWKK